MCGGSNPLNINTYTDPLTDAVEDVAKVVVGGVEVVADDFLGIDDSGGIVGSVKEIGEGFEDAIRSVVNELDNAIQDPRLVELAALVADSYAPGSGELVRATANAYATLDSGENLSATQIANLSAAYGTQDFSNLKLSKAQAKAIKTAGKAVDSKDPLKVLAQTYGDDFAKDLGLTKAAQSGLKKAVGSDAYNLVKNNLDLARVGYDVLVENKSPLEAIRNEYGDQIAVGLGGDDETLQALAYGGLTTAVELDKGTNADMALLKGAKEYRDRGGEFSNLGDIAGITNRNIDLGGLINTPDFFNKYKNYLGESVDLAGVEDWVREYSPYIEDSARYVADLLPKTSIDIQDRGTMEWLADFEGQAPDLSYIEDYARRYGSQIEDGVRWAIEQFPEFRLAFLQKQEAIPGTKVTKDGEEIVSLDSEFDVAAGDEPLFSREVLARTPTIV
jgi:hypothetical protein